MKGDRLVLGTGIRTIKLAFVELGDDCVFEFSCPTCGLIQTADAALGHRWCSIAGFPIVPLQELVGVGWCDRCHSAVSVPISDTVRAKFLEAYQAKHFKMSANPMRALASWWLPALFSILGGSGGVLLTTTFLSKPRIGDLAWWRWLENVMTSDAPARIFSQIPTSALFGGIAGLIIGCTLFIWVARSWIASTRL
jgi:hypothetical protein